MRPPSTMTTTIRCDAPLMRVRGTTHAHSTVIIRPGVRVRVRVRVGI